MCVCVCVYTPIGGGGGEAQVVYWCSICNNSESVVLFTLAANETVYIGLLWRPVVY